MSCVSVGLGAGEAASEGGDFVEGVLFDAELVLVEVFYEEVSGEGFEVVGQGVFGDFVVFGKFLLEFGEGKGFVFHEDEEDLLAGFVIEAGDGFFEVLGEAVEGFLACFGLGFGGGGHRSHLMVNNY